MSWISGARARLYLLVANRAAESRMNEEVSFHIAMETDRLIREERLSPEEARRRAFVTFGGVAHHTEALRDGRGLAWLGGLSLDFKLGFRMLVKYPGLTVIGGLAMAFAIWVGAVTFEMVTMLANPRLPLPGGDRIVELRNWDAATSDAEPRAVYDFLIWRETLRSVSDLGAYRDVMRNLIASDGDARPVQLAEMTSSGFQIASGRPLLGRMLAAADEGAGATPVIVLSHDVWRTRFAGDSSIIGRTVRIDDTYANVVGVMPDGFAFPVSHDAWMPLKIDVRDRAPRSGPGITIFGRLAPGITLEAAQAELTALGRRAAVERRETHEHLQPQVGSYAKQFRQMSPDDMSAFFAIPVFALMLLGLICGNVALLLFARAATRETELIVRSALGASRARIITQLFAEALVLGGVAAVVGLGAAHLALRRWGLEFLEANNGRMPFWYDVHLSPPTVAYVVVLTVLTAVIAGAMPALKITRGLGSSMKQGTAGAGVRFSGVWTAVIIAQVAATVAFPGVVFVEQRELVHIRSNSAGFAAEQYLAVKLEMEAPAGSGGGGEAAWAAHRARFGIALEALRQRVTAEPGVTGVTFVDRLPRLPHSERWIETDDAEDARSQAGRATPANALPEVNVANIDPSYFDVLETPILAGRRFNAGDLAPATRAVIVDQGFIDQVLRGRNPIGRRIRFSDTPTPRARGADESRPWYEIVGVVKNLGMGPATRRRPAAGLYVPASLDRPGTVQMLVHAQGDPAALTPRLRAIATAVNPNMRLSEIQRVDQATDAILWVVGLWIKMTVLLTAIALLLSLAGIYAVLSFTVARRTREIGVRVALGASARRVVAAIFRRPLTQVALGVAAGGILVGVLAYLEVRGFVDGAATFDEGLSLGQIALLFAYATLMFGVCLLACIVPTRRALGVEPTEALRAE